MVSGQVISLRGKVTGLQLPQTKLWTRVYTCKNQCGALALSAECPLPKLCSTCYAPLVEDVKARNFYRSQELQLEIRSKACSMRSSLLVVLVTDELVDAFSIGESVHVIGAAMLDEIPGERDLHDRQFARPIVDASNVLSVPAAKRRRSSIPVAPLELSNRLFPSFGEQHWFEKLRLMLLLAMVPRSEVCGAHLLIICDDSARAIVDTYLNRAVELCGGTFVRDMSDAFPDLTGHRDSLFLSGGQMACAGSFVVVPHLDELKKTSLVALSCALEGSMHVRRGEAAMEVIIRSSVVAVCSEVAQNRLPLDLRRQFDLVCVVRSDDAFDQAWIQHLLSSDDFCCEQQHWLPPISQTTDISPSAAQLLQSYYVTVRKHQATATSGAKLLQTLVRIAKTHAAGSSRCCATLNDALIAILLVEESFMTGNAGNSVFGFTCLANAMLNLRSLGKIHDQWQMWSDQVKRVCHHTLLESEE
eukprot:TRINITY_DN471_c0_g1_i1.p1 TRINITY_DN471_c0_g1~~TRINITY_DN471_c0_g1_i1.p1  ORF type:complete len:473 (-),score=50.89 TRINITY_DN471_c0_g1_i1:1504-2922(-)